MTDPVNLLHYLYISIVGLCFGSFATALVYRIPRSIPWIYDIKSSNNKACCSACPICGAKLTMRDLVPVFSWLFAKGKCRHCKAPVSPRYPLIEIATMIATLILFHVWGVEIYTIPVLLAVPFLIAALLIDWEHMILPNEINAALAFLSLIFIGLRAWDGQGGLQDSLIAGGVLTALLWGLSWALTKWKGRAALGQGDLKFLPAAGLFIGLGGLPSYLALSGALGVITALISRKTQDKQVFPFGPALIISLYLHLILTGMGFDYRW